MMKENRSFLSLSSFHLDKESADVGKRSQYAQHLTDCPAMDSDDGTPFLACADKQDTAMVIVIRYP